MGCFTKTGFSRWMVFVVLCIPPVALMANDRPMFGDISDGSAARKIHRINIFTEEGDIIKAGDNLPLPFSTKQTCGRCHNYEKIARGWHFNALNPDVPPGRNAEPWIIADPAAATQIPVSYRNVRGLYHPDSLGISRWEYVLMFGRHLSGGIGEDMEAQPDFDARWMESGELDINCLACHNAGSTHHQGQYAAQIKKQNFRWATASTCGFATVSGSAKDMPDMYDYLMPTAPEDPKLVQPAISYDKTRFGDRDRIFFDITKNVSSDRCYFCHSTTIAGDHSRQDEDVHITAGLNCADCHRHGFDHNIVRGYEGQDGLSDDVDATTLTCRGCHLGDKDADIPTAGRLGSPVPKHKGLPEIHLEKLTCTACHSGPWPAEPIRIKTSRAHKLGTRGVNRSPDALPHITRTVFAKDSDGRVAPHNILWPAFWATLKDQKIAPIALDIVKSVTTRVIKAGRSGDWPEMTTEQIKEILLELTPKVSQTGKAVYIAGGKLYQLSDSGELATSDHEAADPYLWPVAHNVRPAAQSLGIRGCEDCHSEDSPFLFGTVPIDSPVSGETATLNMQHFHSADLQTYKPVASFFKWLTIIVMSLLVLHICGDLLRRILRKNTNPAD